MDTRNTKNDSAAPIANARTRHPPIEPGQRFGRWVIVGRSDVRENNSPTWLCRCDCGNEASVRTGRLNYGQSSSCGCLRRDSVTTHGMTHSLTYATWKSMILRCEAKTNASYKHYGGKGIGVAPEWRDSFEQFFADMGERPTSKHSIDRVDNALGYSKDNCRWATAREQSRNRTDTKLTDEKAAEIKRLYDMGFLQGEIARVFGVSAPMISMICSGHSWRSD